MSNVKEGNPVINPEEFEVAKKEAESSSGTYIHKLRKPFTCIVGTEEKTFNELTFEWDNLTCDDSLSSENELMQIGKMVLVPTFSGEYLIKMVTKACTVPIGSDEIRMKMSAGDWHRIRKEIRSFFQKSEQ